MKRIVLTGGPCGGKTTSLARITERLQNLGFATYVVPEVATMVFGAAALHPPSMSPSELFGFESAMLHMQLNLEDQFIKLASYSKKPAVLLCDRGTMDVPAFLKPEMWQALLDEGRHREIDLRDGRYDAVVHITTAAEGAEEFYSLDNNLARTETAEEAREIDRKILKSWTGHPHLRQIKNDQSFESKIQAIVAAVCNAVGVPEPYEIERWFRVGEVQEIPVHNVTVPIEQVYLLDADPNLEVRVRCRGGKGEGHIYTYCTKQRVSPGVAIEKERHIEAREYIECLALRDHDRNIVEKDRTCFIWKGQYFELDRFANGSIRLEVEVPSLETEIELPPFLDIQEEVTGQEAYSNYTLSLIKG